MLLVFVSVVVVVVVVVALTAFSFAWQGRMCFLLLIHYLFTLMYFVVDAHALLQPHAGQNLMGRMVPARILAHLGLTIPANCL